MNDFEHALLIRIDNIYRALHKEIPAPLSGELRALKTLWYDQALKIDELESSLKLLHARHESLCDAFRRHQAKDH